MHSSPSQLQNDWIRIQGVQEPGTAEDASRASRASRADEAPRRALLSSRDGPRKQQARSGKTTRYLRPSRPKSAGCLRMRPRVSSLIDKSLVQTGAPLFPALQIRPTTPVAQPTLSIEQTFSTKTSNNPFFSTREIENSIQKSLTIMSTSSCCTLKKRDTLHRLLCDPIAGSKSSMIFYLFGKVLGIGSFGKVRSGLHKLTQMRVAIKTYEHKHVQDARTWKRIELEIKLMAQCHHPNIVRMFESVILPKRIHIVMEYISGTNLSDLVKTKGKVSERYAQSIFEQIVCAVSYLHKRNIVHRDIKLENILYDELETIKIVDFGFSVVCEERRRLHLFCGTPSYMAPELVSRTPYVGKPVDCWSLGVLLYTLLCGRFPFRGRGCTDLYRSIQRGNYDVPEHLSPSVRSLLAHLLERDPVARCTIEQVRGHDWLNASTVDAQGSSLPTKVAHLRSSEPIQDLSPLALESIEKMVGIPKPELTAAILQGQHSSRTSLYYLLLSSAERLRHALYIKSNPFQSSKNEKEEKGDTAPRQE